MVTPGIKVDVDPDKDPKLAPAEATVYRKIVARCNFLAADRPDIQFATKECAKGMSNPKVSDMEKLKRLGRYLKGKPRYIILYRQQSSVYSINGFTDADYAGDTVSRKSTSGGALCIGDHCVKSWATTQNVIALSSAESEYYALTKCAAQSMGLQSLMKDLGVDLSIRVMTDASAAKAIACRRGLGKVRHIATRFSLAT